MAVRRALVTGAGTDIGKGAAKELAHESAEVVLHSSRSADTALAAAEEINSAGGRAHAIHADSSHPMTPATSSAKR